MKKTISYILIIVMALGMAACDIKEDQIGSRSLYSHGLDIVNMLAEMTQSEDIVGIYTANSEIKDVILALGEQNYDTPDAVYAITIPEETLTDMAELSSMQDISEALKCYLSQRVLASLISQINAMGGVEKLAASSVCTVGKTFVCENADSGVIYLYVYEDAAPVAVTFTLGDDHTVSASGTFVLYDEFTCDSAEDISGAFNDITVSVTEVSADR